ncbi:MAG: Uma2 family endonuclease [Methylovulum miyakonense]|uniref:Uma2 family endonuclease n=1 Tax=Methylovulum miyakonense TaxID=645578 RepID=UPI003BB579A0
MNTVLKPRFTADDYLQWENGQSEKHEYLAGEVFAMAGARREHVVVSLNIAAAFKQALRGSGCQTYIADMKLRVEQADAFFYPDVMVSCSAQDHRAGLYLSEPKLIVEVLSDATAAFDRGGKFAAYRSLPSLQEYIIVDIADRRVECFRRTADNGWLLQDYIGEQLCQFTSIGVSMALAEVFEDVVVEGGDAVG